MQLTIEIDDDLAEKFFESTPKDEQQTAFKEMFLHYLQKKIAKKDKDDELDFVGMWADRDMNVDEFIRNSRKGRYFNDN